jgi:hypothetical protein
MNTATTLAPVLVATILVCGCDGVAADSNTMEGLPDGAAASFEGVFELTAWTQNDADCDSAGMDVLAMSSDLHFALVASEVFGQSTLRLMSCIDVADCLDKVDAVRNKQPYSFQFGAVLSEQVSADELTGFTATTGFEENGTCTMREFEEHTLVRAGDTASLDNRVKGLADKPAEDGFCIVDAASAAQEAASASCVSVSALHGQRVADI